MYLMPEDD